MIVNDDGKRYRVASWLERLAPLHWRLSEVRALSRQMSIDYDDVRAVRYDEVTGGRAMPKADKVGDAVVRREEIMERVGVEMGDLERAISCAERVITEAWKANEGVADRDFRYILERYGRGKRHADAARAAGLGRWEAMLSVRKVAPMIYDHAAELFTKPLDESGYYGYREFSEGL